MTVLFKHVESARGPSVYQLEKLLFYLLSLCRFKTIQFTAYPFRSGGNHI
ncbi:hypothetical protein GGR03_001727 [Aurantimonas endophytica]|uniref:Uncharacterized protein n=1 Tax=Aurantimonas endophytica TaxID=1522175 RepID=A0A7W6HCR2_9HYPH|nr:hypothetical protein [Aurantimonas endophytica]